MLLEVSRRGAGAGEYRNAVAILVGIDEVDCSGEIRGLETDENRSEDLFRVTFHMRFDICDESGPNLETDQMSIGAF